MATVYLGLGSNLGNRKSNIKSALIYLGKNEVEVKKISTIIETEPVGGPRQSKFLNAVIEAETRLNPEDLLALIKIIEQKLGREKTAVNAPRPIDIDILLYDRVRIDTPQLTIPHPRMLVRDFVLNPLREIAPLVAQEIQK